MSGSSLTIEQAEELVSETFQTQFEAAEPGVPILWDAVGEDTEGKETWVRFSMQFAGGFQAELEHKQFRRTGVLFVQLFVPSTKGKGAARALAESALPIFEGQAIGPVRFRNVGVIDVGVDRAWFQSNVVCDFEYDQFR